MRTHEIPTTIASHPTTRSLARSLGLLVGTDLITLEELREVLGDFEVLRTEIVSTPVHDPAACECQRWTTAIFHARKPA